MQSKLLFAKRKKMDFKYTKEFLGKPIGTIEKNGKLIKEFKGIDLVSSELCVLGWLFNNTKNTERLLLILKKVVSITVQLNQIKSVDESEKESTKIMEGFY